MNDATTSALLKEIASTLKPLSALKESFSFNLSNDFFGALFAAFSAIAVALFLDKIRRRIEISKIMLVKVVKHPQNNKWYYRLWLKNDSDYIAKNVVVNLEKVIDDDGNNREILLTPLSWTHRDEESRDIFPHQDAYLNICEVQLEQNKFIRLTAPRIMHLDDMVIVKKGTTKILLRYYQENGQNDEIKLKIEWNGNESSFDQDNLPEITGYL